MLPDPSSTSRPPRPNSIEVKRNYPPGSSGAYPNNEESAYGTRHSRSPQDGMYRSVIRFFKEDKNVVKIIERKEHEGYPVMCFPCWLVYDLIMNIIRSINHISLIMPELGYPSIHQKR